MTHTPETLKAAEDATKGHAFVPEIRQAFLAGYDYRQKEIQDKPFLSVIDKQATIIHDLEKEIDELAEFIKETCIPYLGGRATSSALTLIQKHKR